MNDENDGGFSPPSDDWRTPPASSVGTQETRDVNDVSDQDDRVPFNIPRNVAPVNEVHELVRLLWIENPTSKSQQLFTNILFDVLCAQACDEVTTENDPDKMLSLYDLAATNFTLAMTTFPKKKYVLDNLMQYLPECLIASLLILKRCSPLCRRFHFGARTTEPQSTRLTRQNASVSLEAKFGMRI
jgi:hypothetical protein